ncbi:lipid II:glycine glycyltransferase FemX [Borrelia hermsii]|uniref:N-acetylmuramoylpentapeptide-ornithine N(5)-glycyltransferase n=3 Tax=Borrelia hermsii TaxID=140 RepID=A0AAN1CER5_BORHE|nr:peptidoglycan bridge formation glycyltransferase FemA/FemB family protein [Borrelia hermsii]AAX17091.1 N-acetylmuramoylpentapeptide-ornithine N(5)-glycyltransferase [Borrelia hermsii DAH]AMR75265.1 N-acetylmuramoylpentapeptide-ornithine N(5)-glycyltransferase [Borrelia hermsii]ANA43390.1 peptidoglycan bridge formation protein FemAB [Borrelia hermsii HS1]UPA07896.1 peptidoglycan bridge formation glycyltransferase FemA/FemB family protein [Borrelia hermsii DAH]
MNIKKTQIESLNENYLQSKLWTIVKKTSSNKSPWKAIALSSDHFNKILVMQRKIFGNLYLSYIAHPEFSNKKIEEINAYELNTQIKKFSEDIRQYLHKNTIFVRYDLMFYTTRSLKEDYIPLKLKFKNLKKSFDDIQPSNTTILDLQDSLDAIKAKMKKKTRYNINLSSKKNIKVIIDDDFKYFDEFYKLHKETAQRDKFAIHSKDYIKNLIKAFTEDTNSKIKLIIALHNEQLISGIIVGIYKDKATYLYGASSRSNRHLMPNYAVQFKTIQMLKSLSIKEYDLLGIPPTADAKHPLFGLFQFKTGFGGKLIHRIGCYDFVYKKFLYKVYSILEILRYIYYKIIKKRF